MARVKTKCIWHERCSDQPDTTTLTRPMNGDVIQSRDLVLLWHTDRADVVRYLHQDCERCVCWRCAGSRARAGRWGSWPVASASVFCRCSGTWSPESGTWSWWAVREKPACEQRQTAALRGHTLHALAQMSIMSFFRDLLLTSGVTEQTTTAGETGFIAAKRDILVLFVLRSVGLVM